MLKLTDEFIDPIYRMSLHSVISGPSRDHTVVLKSYNYKYDEEQTQNIPVN